MNQDFHYYGTYCAAILAGYTAEESLSIAYCANFVDFCTRSLLVRIKGPLAAATSMQQLEMMDSGVDLISLQNITRIWSSFHFLPGDLHAARRGCGRRYLNKYRLICNPNGELAAATVKLAKDKGLEAAGIAMHVLADTWAHRYFAGTPSLAINNTNDHFYELTPSGDGYEERQVRFIHNPGAPDDLEKGVYVNTLYQPNENTVMNLGHGRAGHLPDYSFMRYKYMPAWGGYREILKDNPSDYWNAFCQMVYAIGSLKDQDGHFETDRYAEDEVRPYRDRIRQILVRRQPDSCADWKALGEELSGCRIPDFDVELYKKEYMEAEKELRDETALGQFIIAALAQKSMITNRIFSSGSLLAGFSVELKGKRLPGIQDFRKLLEIRRKNHDR
ncbi:MAG: DUF6765 family protein [Lachnospiraceae bacterium]|nr:DUF6765 family protein [Lachnospiraceae bacterium]